MNVPSLVFAGGSAAAMFVGATGLVLRPPSRLARRVRPYTVVARTRLGLPVDVVHRQPPGATRTARILFVTPIAEGLGWLGRIVERRGDTALEAALAHAGLPEVSAADHRTRVAVETCGAAVVGAVVGAVAVKSVPVMLILVVCASAYGASRSGARLNRAIARRREQARLELYTVNQLLAMHVRSGAGPVQATQRIVDRGHGVLVEDLDAVLRLIRSGWSEADAFRRVADRTAEPAAARTYRLFAAAAERGIDLAGALLSLSDDLRDERREDIKRSATKRRAAMLLPTIGVLAPIMLLFIAAPLPSIVFGSR